MEFTIQVFKKISIKPQVNLLTKNTVINTQFLTVNLNQIKILTIKHKINKIYNNQKFYQNFLLSKQVKKIPKKLKFTKKLFNYIIQKILWDKVQMIIKSTFLIMEKFIILNMISKILTKKFLKLVIYNLKFKKANQIPNNLKYQTIICF